MKLRYSKKHKALHRLGIIKSKVFPKGLTWLVLNLLRVPKGRNLATMWGGGHPSRHLSWTHGRSVLVVNMNVTSSDI